MTNKINLKDSELYCLVDESDFKFVSKYIWRLSHNGYARNSSGVRMHRLLLNAPRSMEVDHINGNRLDNRRSNLRLATRQENNRNRSKNRSRKHDIKFKGVYRQTKSATYSAVIRLNGLNKYLGSFDCAISAAKAYDKAAIELFGEFAKTNFIATLHDCESHERHTNDQGHSL